MTIKWAMLKVDGNYKYIESWHDSFEDAYRTEQGWNRVYKKWVNSDKSPYFIWGFKFQ